LLIFSTIQNIDEIFIDFSFFYQFEDAFPVVKVKQTRIAKIVARNEN
jgi:hypothetical protein